MSLVARSNVDQPWKGERDSSLHLTSLDRKTGETGVWINRLQRAELRGMEKPNNTYCMLHVQGQKPRVSPILTIFLQSSLLKYILKQVSSIIINLTRGISGLTQPPTLDTLWETHTHPNFNRMSCSNETTNSKQINTPSVLLGQ